MGRPLGSKNKPKNVVVKDLTIQDEMIRKFIEIIQAINLDHNASDTDVYLIDVYADYSAPIDQYPKNGIPIISAGDIKRYQNEMQSNL